MLDNYTPCRRIKLKSNKTNSKGCIDVITSNSNNEVLVVENLVKSDIHSVDKVWLHLASFINRHQIGVNEFRYSFITSIKAIKETILCI